MSGIFLKNLRETAFTVRTAYCVVMSSEQAVSQLYHRTFIIFTISVKSQNLFIARQREDFFTKVGQNIDCFLCWYDFHTIHHPPSCVTKSATPTMLIILTMSKQLHKIDASALTPARPRNKKSATFKLCFICPNGNSAFCLRSL